MLSTSSGDQELYPIYVFQEAIIWETSQKATIWEMPRLNAQ